uniref:Uncharacterized protein n=1 Tax=Arion vulgaris TaxID=1028688 RepID=A0A0B6ZUL3_9EUPU
MEPWAGDLSDVNDAWWETAYQVFLTKEPLRKILNFAKQHKTKNNWGDFGFDITSVVPYYGEIHHVDKRAIIVVLAKARLWEGRARDNFKDLKDYIQRLVQKGTALEMTSPPLQSQTIAMINVMMKLMYNEDGTPIQRNQPELLLSLTNDQKKLILDLIYDKLDFILKWI